MSDFPRPFANPMQGVRVVEGAPALSRPSREEVEAFPAEAVKLLDQRGAAQRVAVDRYALDWVKGRHFVIVGGTGLGIGCSVAVALLDLVAESGSLTVVARDLSRSLGYATGDEMQMRATNLGDRFHWINDGYALEGRALDKIVDALKAADAEDVVYINSMAAASSGMLPGYPPTFVKDVDAEGLFQ
ncbi:MAG: hypothetical protein F4215_05535, partial [Gemmatimonadetes bacterium]|nr:hypothetical protein [Gemmatimonadota bacterium]